MTHLQRVAYGTFPGMKVRIAFIPHAITPVYALGKARVQKRRCANYNTTVHHFSPRASITPAWGIWTTLLSAAAVGQLSARTAVGAALSPPLVSTLITLVAANVGCIPPVHTAYTVVNTVFVPLAVPLLLLAADLRRVASDTGRLFPAFVIGSIATTIATIVAFYVVPLTPTLAHDAWKIASALCARHIGGAVNYVAVADAVNAGSTSVAAALAADNVLVAAYFLFLFALARGVNDPANNKNIITQQPTPQMNEEREPTRRPITMDDAAVALSLSAFMCALARLLAKLIPIYLGIIPLVTIVALFFATFFPKYLRPYASTGNALGVFFMQVFFAAVGASGSIASVIGSAPMLFLFIAVQLSIHVTILYVVGRVFFRLHPAELLIASNANVGGPATASGMAAAKGWSSLIIPALLVGVFGYSIATFVSLGLGHAVLKPMV